MAIVRTLSRSFAGGEVTPEMADRVDLGQYQTGLARCINAIIYPHGPAQKRGGMSFINWAKYWWEGDTVGNYSRAVNLVPFQFSASQSYVMEFGHHYIRLHAGNYIDGNGDVVEGGTMLDGVNITAEFARSEGIVTGTANKITISKKNHGLLAGQKILVTATASTPVGTQIGTIDAAAGTLPQQQGVLKNHYWVVSVAGGALLSRDMNVGYLVKAKQNDPYDIATSTAGSISGTTFTDTTHGTGNYAVGHYLYGTGIAPGTYITALGTGTGANNGGTYTVNNVPTTNPTGAIEVTGQKEDETKWVCVPIEDWSQFDGTVECTVQADPEDDSFQIDVDSSLLGVAPVTPSVAFESISRGKKASVYVPAHSFSNDDIVRFRLTNKNPSKVNFNTGIDYKVANKATNAFNIKWESEKADETTEWIYLNTKKAFANDRFPKGFVGLSEDVVDEDTADVVYTVVREITSVGTTYFTQTSHGFYDGQTVWFAPADLNINKPGYYQVDVYDANTIRLIEIDGAAITGPGSTNATASAGYVYPVYEIATEYDEADVQSLDFAQSYDVITITHKNYKPTTIKRFGASEWELEKEVFIPDVDIPTDVQAEVNPPGGATRAIFYAVTATVDGNESFPAYVERPPFEVSEIRANVIYNVTARFQGDGYYNDPVSFDAKEIRGGPAIKLASGSLSVGALVRLSVEDGSDDDFIEAFEGTQMNDSYYRVKAKLSNGLYIVSRRSNTPIDWTIYDGDVPSGKIDGHRNGSVLADFSDADCRVQLKWKASPDTLYKVYKRVGGSGGDPLGYIGATETAFFTDDNITPDTSLTPPFGEDPFDAPGSYPACVDYFEQRKVFSGTDIRPQSIWMTQIGTEQNMLQSLPLRSTDSINFRMAGREQNAVKFMAVLQDLIVFTENSEWRVGATEGSVLTPTTVSAHQQSANGCADVKPVVANNGILFVQSGSNRVLKLNYNWNSQSYSAEDVSMLAFHLFEGNTITCMTMERGVFPVLWCVRSDGAMIGLTYIPEQNVIAWHRHVTDGEIVSARAIKEETGPSVYLAVRRTLTQGNRLLIERMDNYTSWLDRIYLDSQKTVTVAAIIDDDAQAIIDRMTVAPSIDTKLAINNLVLDLKTHGVWDKLDALQVYAAHTQQAGLLDWKRTGVSASLSGSATWDADDGIIGSTAASSYVNTAFTPSSDGVEFQLQDATMGCYVVAATTNAVDDEYYFGGRGSNSTYETNLGATSSTRLTARINSGNASTSASSHRSDTGLLAVGVTGSDNTVLSGSGVSLASWTATESGLSNGVVYVGAKNNNGTVNGQCDARIAVWFAGSNLTLAQLAAFETAIEEYMAATPVGQTANLSGFMSLAGKTAHVKLEGSIYTGADVDGYESYSSVAEQVVNSSGQVSIPALFFGEVTAGLKYDAEAKLLPVSFEAAAASRGTVKNISKVFLRANGQGTMYVGPNTDKLVGMIVDQAAAGEIPEIKEVPIVGDWNNDAGLLIKHSDPLPFMLQALVLEIATGG